MNFHLGVASGGNNVKQLRIRLPPEGGTRSRQPPSSPGGRVPWPSPGQVQSLHVRQTRSGIFLVFKAFIINAFELTPLRVLARGSLGPHFKHDGV